MAYEEEFGRLMREFGTSIGLADISPNDEGLVMLAFDELLVVHFGVRADRGELALTTALGSVDPDCRASLFARLLAENFFPAEDDFYFAWDAVGEAVLLTAKSPLAALTVEDLSAWLLRFLNQAKVWRVRLQENQSETPAAEPTERPPQPAATPTFTTNPMLHAASWA